MEFPGLAQVQKSTIVMEHNIATVGVEGFSDDLNFTLFMDSGPQLNEQTTPCRAKGLRFCIQGPYVNGKAY